MSGNCGFRHDKTSATDWWRFVPVVGGLAVVAALVEAVVFTNDGATAGSEGLIAGDRGGTLRGRKDGEHDDARSSRP